MNRSWLRKKFTLFDIVNYLLLSALVVVTLSPFWVVIVGSLNQGLDYMRGGVYLWPREFTWANYIAVFADQAIYKAYLVTIARTLLSTLLHVLFTSLIAYGMSKKQLTGRKYYMMFVIFTMFFWAGLIPTYLLYQKLGLLNNFLVYIIPSLFSAFDMIILMSFMQTIPESVVESAKMDGAGEYRIFLKLILPLTKPALAAITLFHGVKQWNDYYDSMMYTTSESLQVIQLFLQRIVTDIQFAQGMGAQAAASIPQQAIAISPETLKLAMMIATTLPIILVYPFLQKYFIKGMLIGSVKG